jgi:hypothetical protein
MKSFDTHFNDLNENAKKRFLIFCGVESEKELNHEISPLASIDLEFEGEEENNEAF